MANGYDNQLKINAYDEVVNQRQVLMRVTIRWSLNRSLKWTKTCQGWVTFGGCQVWRFDGKAIQELIVIPKLPSAANQVR